MQQALQFSLKVDHIEILWNSQQFILTQGLDAIQRQSLAQGIWSELAIEKMIYLIEELLGRVLIWLCTKLTCKQCKP